MHCRWFPLSYAKMAENFLQYCKDMLKAVIMIRVIMIILILIPIMRITKITVVTTLILI